MSKLGINPNRNPLELIFASKDVEQDPIKMVQGVSVDYRRLRDKRYVVKKLLQIIQQKDHRKNPTSTQWRVGVIEYLEKFFRTSFTCTRDMKMKIGDYLNGYEVRKRPAAARIRRARKKKRWSQQDLAQHLGYKNHVSIAQFEKGLRYPPAKVFRWLEDEKM